MKEEVNDLAPMKDLAYFQQQVAEKYNFETFEHLLFAHTVLRQQPNADHFRNEAAELYAAHRYEQGKQEGARQSFIEIKIDSFKAGELHGWNEAILWAAEQTEIDFVVGNDLKQSILNGLKDTKD